MLRELAPHLRAQKNRVLGWVSRCSLHCFVHISPPKCSELEKRTVLLWNGRVVWGGLAIAQDHWFCGPSCLVIADGPMVRGTSRCAARYCQVLAVLGALCSRAEAPPLQTGSVVGTRFHRVTDRSLVLSYLGSLPHFDTYVRSGHSSHRPNQRGWNG